MARRRDKVEGVAGDVMPEALIEHGARDARRKWCEARQIFGWPAQHDALRRARMAYGLDANGRDPDAPDPREIFRALPNDSPVRPRRRPPGPDRETGIPELPPPF